MFEADLEQLFFKTSVRIWLFDYDLITLFTSITLCTLFIELLYYILYFLKVYMLYDRVMRNIQNKHKRIKHMKSFINARFQRKLRKFTENPLSGSQAWGPTFRVSSPTAHLWVESRVSGLTNSPESRVPLFGYAIFIGPLLHVDWLNSCCLSPRETILLADY